MKQDSELKEKDERENKEYIIYVNTREKRWNNHEISFKEVVALAFENPVFNDQVLYTVGYTKGQDDKPKGTLVEGGKNVKVKNGMAFDVERSDRS